MDGQQIIALLLVGGAFVYMARYFAASVKSMISDRGGCGGGCGKCSSASQEGESGQGQKRPNFIAISEIQTLPSRTPIDEFLNRQPPQQ